MGPFYTMDTDSVTTSTHKAFRQLLHVLAGSRSALVRGKGDKQDLLADLNGHANERNTANDHSVILAFFGWTLLKNF